jgi:lysine 2,3-aminomutase
MARRKPRVVADGCGGEAEAGTDGDTLRPIIPLPVLNGNGSGSGSGHAANG